MFWVHCALSESVAPAASAALPERTGPLTAPSAGAQDHPARPVSNPGLLTRLPPGGGGGLVGVGVGRGVGGELVGGGVGRGVGGGGPSPPVSALKAPAKACGDWLSPLQLPLAV